MRIVFLGLALMLLATHPVSADGLSPVQPDAYGCRGWSFAQHTVNTDTGVPDRVTGDALVKSGECFPLKGATLKDLKQDRLGTARVLAILPDGRAEKLWVWYYSLYGHSQDWGQAHLGSCVNDCRD